MWGGWVWEGGRDWVTYFKCSNIVHEIETDAVCIVPTRPASPPTAEEERLGCGGGLGLKEEVSQSGHRENSVGRNTGTGQDSHVELLRHSEHEPDILLMKAGRTRA